MRTLEEALENDLVSNGGFSECGAGVVDVDKQRGMSLVVSCGQMSLNSLQTDFQELKGITDEKASSCRCGQLQLRVLCVPIA